MKKRNCPKISILLALFFFIFSGADTIARACDGGGGGGADAPGSGDQGLTQITRLSDEEVAQIFSLLDEASRQTMTNAFAGSDYTARQLMAIRQQILERESQSANAEASLIHGLTVTVEFLDEAGQWSQFGLAFVPGVGWVSGGLLDTARGGADAYRDGKDVSEIIKNAAIAGVSSVTISKLSPLGADETFNTARGAFNVLRRGSGKQTGKAARVFVKAAVKYVVKKEEEALAGSALSAGLASSTRQVPNRAPGPHYINSSLGYDVTPMGVNVYK